MIGTTLAHYRIDALLGRGGMGEVYRAHDTRLGRDVALKLLPAEFAGDAERLARFEREARTLASLQHPNIAAIHGLEEAGGQRFLIMELVVGADLAERLAGGAVPLDEARSIARQIAEGLAEAHEKGIVHRDLKPANIKVAPDGRVKILDFGLARAFLGEQVAEGNLTLSPTITGAMTQVGVILGTAAYMSPEQARGRAVDRRADIWAFGLVLFEMLTGRRVHEGETLSDTIAGILKVDPDWSCLPAEVPGPLRRLLRRCLQKDPRQRLHSIQDAILELEDAEEEVGIATTPTPHRSRNRFLQALPWGAALFFAAAWLAQGVLRPRARPVATHLDIVPPENGRLVAIAPPVISPDGRWVVLGSADATGEPTLWLRSLDRHELVPLAETKGATFPFWSPDSRTIGYFVAGSLRKLDVATRTSLTICDCAPWGRGGTWAADGTILFVPNPNSGIWRIPASGGTAVAVTALDSGLVDVSHRYPVLLPDGEHFLFTFWSNNNEVAKQHGGVYVGSISAGVQHRLLPDASSAVLVEPDYLLAHRKGKLVAFQFDLSKLEASPQAIPVSDGVMFDVSLGSVAASASKRGDIVFATGSGNVPKDLVWLDRNARNVGAVSERLLGTGFRVSPDGTRFVMEGEAPVGATTGGQDIWIGDLRRKTVSRLTSGANDSYGPVWSPDGVWIAYNNRDSGNEDTFMRKADGTTPPEAVHRGTTMDTQVTDWSEDGTTLFLEASLKEGSKRQLWALDLETRETRILLEDAVAQLTTAQLSPDGRWLAYVSDESGRAEIYVRSYPNLARKWAISREGGTQPHWRRDSKELLYLDPNRAVFTVALAMGAGAELAPGIPEPLFKLPPQVAEVAPTPDHQGFLAAQVVAGERPEPLRVVLNWAAAQRAD